LPPFSFHRFGIRVPTLHEAFELGVEMRLRTWPKVVEAAARLRDKFVGRPRFHADESEQCK
jgi:hypothetical protein